MEIRIASKKDVKILEGILFELKKEFPTWYGVDKAEQMFDEKSKIFIILDREKCVGFADISKENGKEIFNLIYILPDYRGRKLGEKLFGYVIESSETKRIEAYVHHNNARGIKLMNKFGFKKALRQGGDFEKYILEK